MFRQEDYAKASVTELLQKLQHGETCAAALTEFALAIIAEREPALNAITWLYADEARQAAIASDEKRRRGHPCGRLEGIPLLVKDNVDVAGWPTTAGSKALLGIIADHDAPLVKRLREEGAILLGKTAMHELAAGITGASSLSGYTHNAYRPGYNPGGSSSGSAVAVAAGYVPFAVGTDTAGSVRIPAAFNLLYGLRPTRGSVPMAGIVPLSPTQDIAGPLVRHAEDLRWVTEVMTGKSFPPRGETLRIGWLDSAFNDISDTSRNKMRAAVQNIGAEVVTVGVTSLDSLAEAANIIAYEFAESLNAFLSARPQASFTSLQEIVAANIHHPQLDAVFRARAEHAGTNSPEYRGVQQRQRDFYNLLKALFADHDINLLAYPVMRHPPVKHGETQTGSNALFAATSGAPALTFPVGFDEQGFPLGLELLALRDREDLLLNVFLKEQNGAAD